MEYNKCDICKKKNIKFDLIIKNRKIGDASKKNWLSECICMDCAKKIKNIINKLIVKK